MNWTGGKLQRASKKQKSALLSRQKQHFARARTNQQNGTTSASFIPSFFQESGETQETCENNPYGYSKGHQTKLEDYRNVAPVAKRLGAMGSGQHRSRTHLSRIDGNAMSEADTNYSVLASVHEAESDIVVGECDSAPGLEEERKNKNDFRSSRRAEAPSNSSQICQYMIPTKPDGSQTSRLSQSRRNLLAQEDWVGLRRSYPPQIEFPSIIDKEMIGKRRKLTKDDYVRKAGAGERVHIPSVQGEYYMSGALQGRSADKMIKIRVGDDALVSELSSTRSNHLDSLESQASSDSMLMKYGDDDDVGTRHTYDEVRDLLETVHALSYHSASTQEDSSSFAFQADLRAYHADLGPHRNMSSPTESGRARNDTTQKSDVHSSRKLKNVNRQTRRLTISSSPSPPSQPPPKAFDDVASLWANRGSCTKSQTETCDQDMNIHEADVIRDDTWKDLFNFSDEGDPEVPLENEAPVEELEPHRLSQGNLELQKSNTLPCCTGEVRDKEEYAENIETSTILALPPASLNWLTGLKAQPFISTKVDEADELWKQYVFGRCPGEESDELRFPLLNKSAKGQGGHSNVVLSEVAEANRDCPERYSAQSMVAENGDTSSLLSTPHRNFTQQSSCAEPALSQVANASTQCRSTSNVARRDMDISSSPDPLTRLDSERSTDGFRSLSTMQGQARTVFHKPRPFGARRSEDREGSVRNVLHIRSKGRREQSRAAKGCKEEIEDDIEEI